MLITYLTILLISNALSLRKDKSILFSTIVKIALALSTVPAFNNLLAMLLDKGIGIYGDLFHVTAFTQAFNIFIFVVTTVILNITCFYHGKVFYKDWSTQCKILTCIFEYNKPKIYNKMGKQIIQYFSRVVFVKEVPSLYKLLPYEFVYMVFIYFKSFYTLYKKAATCLLILYFSIFISVCYSNIFILSTFFVFDSSILLLLYFNFFNQTFSQKYPLTFKIFNITLIIVALITLVILVKSLIISVIRLYNYILKMNGNNSDSGPSTGNSSGPNGNPNGGPGGGNNGGPGGSNNNKSLKKETDRKRKKKESELKIEQDADARGVNGPDTDCRWIKSKPTADELAAQEREALILRLERDKRINAENQARYTSPYAPIKKNLEQASSDEEFNKILSEFTNIGDEYS
jgi:hypothetical protein